MTINVRGNASISALANHDSHRAALGPIYDIVNRNLKLSRANANTLNALTQQGTYVGGEATFGISVRSCHGDANLRVALNGQTYEGVYNKNDPGFNNTTKLIWRDYLDGASTHHAGGGNNIAAYVEINCSVLSRHERLQNLQQQRTWLIGPSMQRNPIYIGASSASIVPADGSRVLYHVIGDFFLYSPNHYVDGYVVIDDSGNLLQTENFLL